MAPTTPPSRHTLVDALRGLALLGILVVNVEFILQPSEIGWLGYDGTADRVARWLVATFGQMKVYPLFALLFGYGLSIQLANAERRGSPLGPRYRRRLVGIGLLGVLHGILFFPGDILVIYAVVGALAYPFRHRPTRWLLRTAAIVYGLAALVWLLLGSAEAVFGADDPTAPADAVATFTSGSWVEVIGLQVGYWLVTLGILSLVQGPAVFACFLVGIALGRTDILARPDDHRPLARRALTLAPLGLAGAALGATLTLLGGRWVTLGFAVGFAIAPLVTAGYVALLAVGIDRGHRWLGSTLQASGRMSLSVYLLESIVVSTLSYGYGFGLFGRLGPVAGVALALAVWGGLSLLARWWMRRFRFGPFEWALRSFTYGRLEPIRPSPPPTPVTAPPSSPAAEPDPGPGSGFVAGADQTGE